MVYNVKKKLKGTGTVVSENLTKERYALYKKCLIKFGRENVWTSDCRIFCLTGRTDLNDRPERLVVTKEEHIY